MRTRNALLLTLAIVVTSPAGAQARIGETPDQLVARYDQPVNETDQKADGTKISLARVTFQKGGYEIDVTITGGLSVQEIFKKLNGQPITLEEARTLLSDNSQGMQWSAPVKTEDALVWTRDDNAVGQLSNDGSMIIRSAQLTAQEVHAKRLQEHPSLDGF
jgi:hypothetical protein